jgi:phage gp29-like protein
MEDNKKVITRETEKAPENIVINQIVIRPVDRSPKDIHKWRNAHIYAERVIHANRVPLYDLYDDIRLDGHLTGIIEKRISSVRNKNLHFMRDGKIVEEFDDLIESKPFRDLITEIMESKTWGISGVEFIPSKELEWRHIPRKHIKPQLKRITKEQYGDDGFDYVQNPFIWVIGEDHDLGLLLKCAPYALYKRGSLADWSQYIEIFGQPVRIVKYDAYDEKTKIELQQVLDEAGSSLALMIPKQADFDMKDGKQSNGDGKLQSTFKDAMNAEMSVIVLGNTETTVSSSSSGYAQSETHSKQQNELVKDDLKFVENTLNDKKFLQILASYGWQVEGGKFEFELELDLNYLRMRKEIDDFVSKKVPVGDDYYYNKYGVPKPENYEELKAHMEEMQQLSIAGKMMSNKKNGLPVNHDTGAGNGKGKKGKGKDKNKGNDNEDAKDLPDQSDKRLKWRERLGLVLADFFGQALKN